MTDTSIDALLREPAERQISMASSDAASDPMSDSVSDSTRLGVAA
ncbi:hypothetical protein SKC41_23575 [Mycobacterium sp. 050128]